MLKRSLWGLADQAVYSFCSLLLMVWVAREASPWVLGAWGIGYAFYTFALTVTRGVISTTALVQSNSSDVFSGDRFVDRGALAASLGFGFGMGVILAGVGWLTRESEVGPYLLVFGALFPFLFLQDACRYCLIRNSRVGAAFIVDLIWFVCFAASFGSSFAFDSTPLVATILWGVSSGLSLIAGLLLVRLRLTFCLGWKFLKKFRTASSLLFIETVLGAAVANFIPALLGLVLTLAEVGYFRGALTLLGVVGIAISGLSPVVTVEAVKRLSAGGSAGTIVFVWSSVIAFVGLVTTVFLAVIPDAIGVGLLGDSWSGTRVIVVLMAVQVIFRGPITGVPIVFRAVHDFNGVLVFRLWQCAISLLMIIGGAAAYGLDGAAVGWVGASVVNSVVAVIFLVQRPSRLKGYCD